jgi:hypothetical protein
VASPHQIAAGVFARTHEVARGFLFRDRDADRRDLAKAKQPRQPLGITPVSLDPIGCSSDPRRCGDDAVDPRLGTRAREPVPGWPRLVHDPDRLRQCLQPRNRRLSTRRQAQRPHLAAALIDHTRDHRASVHIESDPATFAHNRRLP